MEDKENRLQQIRKNRDQFTRYNQLRRDKLYASIKDQAKIQLFESIPFLLCTNQPDIPGYIAADDMVGGIYGYQPTINVTGFIKARFPSAKTVLESNKDPFIQMFALMGSGGTIAFNSQSDLDFWICANLTKYGKEQISSFKLKCRDIEEWIAEHYNLEVHFFLNDIEKVKKNIFDEDEEDSMAGSSLGELLKEEFFRSSIVINGRIPFWWVVPGNSDDKTYNEWLRDARDLNLADDYIDIGNLHSVVREGFLGAGLFQILKSLGSPFKSIIKIGLLEKYIHSSGANPYISNIVKQNVHKGDFKLHCIDSYVIMFNDVYEFYNSVMNDNSATELLKTCFYLKVDPRLSEDSPAGDTEVSEKCIKMKEYVDQWGWAENTIIEMDDFDNWDIEQITGLWNNTKKHILKSYKDILSFLEKSHVTSVFTGGELKGISRKIISHFSISDDKVDNTLTFKSYPPEKLLTIDFIRDKAGKEYWTISKKVISKTHSFRTILHKENSLIALIVWVSLNRLFNKDYTRMDIATGYYPVDPNFLREMISDLSVYFPLKKLDLRNSYFLRDPLPLLGYIIINPYTKYAKDVEGIIFLYHNSWGETRFEHYKNITDIPGIITRILNGSLILKRELKNPVRIISSSPYRGTKEFLTTRQFVEDICRFFTADAPGQRMRYLTIFRNNYFVYTRKKKGADEYVECKSFDSELKMMYSLSLNTGIKNKIGLDSSPELNHLRKIINNYREDAIQIYYYKEHKFCNFYISDERGSIIFIRKKAEVFMDYLTRLYAFSRNLVTIIEKENPGSPLARGRNRVEIYHLVRDVRNNCAVRDAGNDLEITMAEKNKKIMPSGLSLHLLKNNEIGYRFSLPDGSYTDIFTKNTTAKAIKSLAAHMKKTGGYSFYVTDIDLSAVDLKAYRDYTSFAFSQKNLFEMLLERGLAAIQAGKM